MEILGRFTAGVLAVIGVLAVGVAVASVPDVKRYLKMRAM